MTRIVIHYSDSTVFGGTERAILHLVAAMDRATWRPVLLHHADAPEALIDGARQAGAETREVPRVTGKLDVRRLASLVREIRTIRPTVFHAHLPWPLACKYGIVAASAARVPVIVATAQLHVELDAAGFVDAQHHMITRLVGRYIAVSNDVAGHLMRRFRVPDGRIVVIPNAVDVAEITVGLSHPPSAWPVPIGRKAALVLARLENEKGVDVAIDAMAQLSELDLVIAGSGSCRAALEARVQRLGLGERVHFLGHRSDPASLLARADLFVLPSLVEGFPLSVLEAMAAGVPVVATDIGGTRETVDNGRTGVLVPPRDAAGLAAAMRHVLESPDEATRRAAAARERVLTEFSSTTIASRVAALYESVASAKP